MNLDFDDDNGRDAGKLAKILLLGAAAFSLFLFLAMAAFTLMLAGAWAILSGLL